MMRMLTLCTLALLAAAPAPAGLRAIEQAYELAVGEARLPARPDGSLRVQPCPGCASVTLRLSADTRYLLAPAGRALTFKEFAAERARQAGVPGAVLVVFYDPATGLARRLVLRPGR